MGKYDTLDLAKQDLVLTRGKCRDCGLVRGVSRMAWSRAANPRCLACGGMLDRQPGMWKPAEVAKKAAPGKKARKRKAKAKRKWLSEAARREKEARLAAKKARSREARMDEASGVVALAAKEAAEAGLCLDHPPGEPWRWSISYRGQPVLNYDGSNRCVKEASGRQQFLLPRQVVELAKALALRMR